MSLTIWKYPLAVFEEQNVRMPVGARALSVAAHNGTLTLWALGNPSAILEQRRVFVVGTGEPFNHPASRFIGTVVMPTFVWHVFIEMTLAETIAEIL